MLKNIRLHLHQDEEQQTQLEQQLAQHILVTHKQNINAFQRNIPSLAGLVKQPNLQNYSLFCNKFGEYNIVDYGLGRTFYGFHPHTEIRAQVANFRQHSGKVSMLNGANIIPQTIETEETLKLRNLPAYQSHIKHAPLPQTIDCLVMLGCGLAQQIEELLLNHTIKNLIVYEPELQYFQCSVLVGPWQHIFTLAQTKGTAVFLQIQKDGRDIISDMRELEQHTGINSFYLYKHYNHPVFDSLYEDLLNRNWTDIAQHGFSFKNEQHYTQYVPTWTHPVNVTQLNDVSCETPLFQRNLEAFKRYFPKIYNDYKDYRPKHWLPVATEAGEVSLIKQSNLISWYSDSPKSDCEYNFDNFNEQPNKDGLVLGYKGNKLAHYLHYQFVKETEELLQQAEDEIGALPEKVASIIMFGLGVGYQLEKLLAEHEVEKLFICEPNQDFFYASLFAIDWHSILTKVDESEARIYLNIGDDGSHLFRDLLSQFHSIGPYILNNTYFYQSYYNASLNSAIAQLREQLQVVISMGEYFDHAYYGIEHTKAVLDRGTPVLRKNPSKLLSYDDKEVPVFIVGNGPSLDLSIEAIKEWQERAIVISCGTALQALHRNGITPDFHAEIEQNRSTFDWAYLVEDLDYLKQITLISCNGIHPDTCDLYKDVLVAFKEGESSTVSALNVLGEDKYETLKHAFPTVSNFVTDLISTLGFNNIYLMGVDLGFIDVKHHHSKSSGYYQQDGSETYNYAERNNTSLIVPGNFRPTVNTKHEFKISRQIIEQVTYKRPKSQTFYNCSDGAKIMGTNPLNISDLLIVTNAENKHHALTNLKDTVFSPQLTKGFITKFEDKFSDNVLLNELTSFRTLLEIEIETHSDIEYIINKQKEMMFASYKYGKSLLFYYLYGTANYANALLTKLSSSNIEIVDKAITLWRTLIEKIIKELNRDYERFDTSTHNNAKREQMVLSNQCQGETITIYSSCKVFITSCFWLSDIAYQGKIIFKEGNLAQLEPSEYCVIYYPEKSKEQSQEILTNVTRSKSGIIVTSYTDLDDSLIIPESMQANDDAVVNEFKLANAAIKAALNEHHDSKLLFKTISKSVFDIPEIQTLSLEAEDAIDHVNYLTFTNKGIIPRTLLKSGIRGGYVQNLSSKAVLKIIDKKTYLFHKNDFNEFKKLYLK